MSAFWQALLAAQQAKIDYSGFPLQTHYFDDGDSFLTYEGIFELFRGSNWQGGASNNQFHYVFVVQPGAPLTQATTDVIYLAGTADEYIYTHGANEDGGPCRLWLQALDVAGQPWFNAMDFGSNREFMRYEGQAAQSPVDPASYVRHYGTTTQTVYTRLDQSMAGFEGLPAGRYRMRFEKLVNSAPGDTSANNKALYSDGWSVCSRVPRALWK